MRRLLSLGPPNYAIHELTSQGETVNHLIQPLQGSSGVLLPPGECAMQGEGSVRSWACEGAVCGGSARGSAGLDAVYEEEMVKPLDGMRV
jgi:hypothetical protein